ncbi:MAG TPA: hypothetical protein EYH36_03825 [Desulfocapsa sulfexigens]|nr:hypothetical protein [Desulfocapsa sulfexigens]
MMKSSADTLQKGDAFKQMDRAIIMNPQTPDGRVLFSAMSALMYSTEKKLPLVKQGKKLKN